MTSRGVGMRWFRVSENWEDDPRAECLPWSPALTLLSLWAYCSRELVDVVPPGVQFTRFTRYRNARTSMRDRELLVAAGYLEEMPDGGLRLTGFAEEQGLEQRLAQRDADAERKRRERARQSPDEHPTVAQPLLDGRPTVAQPLPIGRPSGDHRASESGSQTQNSTNVTPDTRARAQEVEVDQIKKEQAVRPSDRRSRDSSRARKADLEQVSPADLPIPIKRALRGLTDDDEDSLKRRAAGGEPGASS